MEVMPRMPSRRSSAGVTHRVAASVAIVVLCLIHRRSEAFLVGGGAGLRKAPIVGVNSAAAAAAATASGAGGRRLRCRRKGAGARAVTTMVASVKVSHSNLYRG